MVICAQEQINLDYLLLSAKTMPHYKTLKYQISEYPITGYGVDRCQNLIRKSVISFLDITGDLSGTGLVFALPKR